MRTSWKRGGRTVGRPAGRRPAYPAQRPPLDRLSLGSNQDITAARAELQLDNSPGHLLSCQFTGPAHFHLLPGIIMISESRQSPQACRLQRSRLTRRTGRAAPINAYLELTKPRITFLVVLSSLAGFVMGSPARVDFIGVLHGDNRYRTPLERDRDAESVPRARSGRQH